MTTLAAVNARYIMLIPVDPSEVPNGALFLDANDGGAAKVKATGGNVDSIGSGATNLFVKPMVTDGAFASGQPVAKKSNGKVVAADSDGISGEQNQIGFAMQASSGPDLLVNVLTCGPNVAGALTGMGFAPGQEVYLGEAGGYVAANHAYQDGDDRIIRLGIADCPGGVASGVATDLVAFTEVIVNP